MASIWSHTDRRLLGILDGAQVDPGQRRAALARLDQWQCDGAVEQIGATGLTGALGRAGDIEDVIEQLEGDPDVLAEAAQHIDRSATGQGAELAGGPEQDSGFSRQRSR